MITTSTVIAALAVVSAAVGAYSAYSSAEAQSDASKYSAAVARNNAMVAQQQAEFDAQQIRDKNRRLVSAQRAAFAASGVDPNSGTPQDVMNDSSIQGEMEALAAIYTGRTSANAHTAQARLDDSRAGYAQSAGMVGVGSSLLTGASGVVGAYTNPNFRKP